MGIIRAQVQKNFKHPREPTLHKIHDTITQLAVPLDGLNPYGKNPRQGNVEAIKESLQHHGQYKPIVVRTGTNEILAGNHTAKAARELGWTDIAATFVDVTDDQAARIVLVDNRTNDLAGYDETALAELLDSLTDLDGTGFDQAAVDDLVFGAEQEPADAPESADELPATPPVTISKPGDVFELGGHRLICGDATDPRVLEELMGADRAALMWTDPPYGVSYEGKTEEALTIQNDGADDLEDLLDRAFETALDFLRPGAPVYVAHSDTRRLTFETALRDSGYLVRQNLIWVKNTLVLGHSDYQYKHEPILEATAGQDTETETETPDHGIDLTESGKAHEPVLYGFTPGANGRLGRGGPRWYGTNNRTTVFEVDKPPASRDHPTMKPVKLILLMMANSIRPGQIVLDPFAGSGSTLIATEYHGAAARVVELDPVYCDVIAARYQKETGNLPIRAGQPVNFLGEE